MSSLHGFVTESTDKWAVSEHGAHLNSQGIEDLISGVLRQLSSQQQVLLVVSLDSLHDLLGILLLEVVLVPFLLFVFEVLSVSPDSVSGIESLSKFLDFRNLSLRKRKDFLIVVELFNVLEVLVELSFKLLKIVESISMRSQLAHKLFIFDLVSEQLNGSSFFIDSLSKGINIGLSSEIDGVLGSVELNLDLLQLSGERLNLLRQNDELTGLALAVVDTTVFILSSMSLQQLFHIFELLFLFAQGSVLLTVVFDLLDKFNISLKNFAVFLE